MRVAAAFGPRSRLARENEVSALNGCCCSRLAGMTTWGEDHQLVAMSRAPEAKIRAMTMR